MAEVPCYMMARKHEKEKGFHVSNIIVNMCKHVGSLLI
jgi:hypothetical protein